MEVDDFAIVRKLHLIFLSTPLILLQKTAAGADHSLKTIPLGQGLVVMLGLRRSDLC